MNDLEKLYKDIKKDNWKNTLYEELFILGVYNYLERKLDFFNKKDSLDVFFKKHQKFKSFTKKYIDKPIKQFQHLKSFHYTKIMKALRRFK